MTLTKNSKILPSLSVLDFLSLEALHFFFTVTPSSVGLCIKGEAAWWNVNEQRGLGLDLRSTIFRLSEINQVTLSLLACNFFFKKVYF